MVVVRGTVKFLGLNCICMIGQLFSHMNYPKWFKIWFRTYCASCIFDMFISWFQSSSCLYECIIIPNILSQYCSALTQTHTCLPWRTVLSFKTDGVKSEMFSSKWQILVPIQYLAFLLLRMSERRRRSGAETTECLRACEWATGSNLVSRCGQMLILIRYTVDQREERRVVDQATVGGTRRAIDRWGNASVGELGRVVKSPGNKDERAEMKEVSAEDKGTEERKSMAAGARRGRWKSSGGGE